MADLKNLPLPTEDDDLEQELEDTSKERTVDQQAPGVDSELVAAVDRWTETLQSVQKSIEEAAAAIRLLRETLKPMAPVLRSLGVLEDALHGFAEEPPPEPRPLREMPSESAPPVTPTPPLRALEEDIALAPQPTLEEEAGEQSWQSWRKKPEEREKPTRAAEKKEDFGAVNIGPPRAALKPVTLVPDDDDTVAPYSYRVTVDDSQKTLKLVSLYQALGAIPAVRNLSLVSYVSGVASISLEATEEILPPDVENAIHKTLKRSCSVLSHDSTTLLVKMGE